MATHVVLVNGLPGSGKSTLARALSDELDAPLLSKSLVKAGIVGSTPHMDLPGAIYGALAMDVIWALVGRAPRVAIVDSHWIRSRDLGFVQQGLERAGAPRAIEVWCDVDPSIAHDRARAARRSKREEFTREWDDLVASAGPLALDSVVRVDTLEPVDVPDLATRLRRRIR